MSHIKYPRVPITPGIVRSEFSLWELESRVFSPEFGILAYFPVINSRDNDVSAVKIFCFLFWTSFVPRDNAISGELTYGKRCETREKLIKIINTRVFASLPVINSQESYLPWQFSPVTEFQGILNNSRELITGKDARLGSWQFLLSFPVSRIFSRKSTPENY